MKWFARLVVWKKLLLVVSLVLAMTVVGFIIWANQVFHAESIARDVRSNHIVTEYNNALVMNPLRPTNRGLVFIPGAKVSPEAYLYKLSGLVDSGITVIITKPYLNLALLDQRPLSAFTTHAPDIRQWYVGGHSLGGVRACQYAAQPGISGLVLFGSYCINDVGVPTISFRGSNDNLTKQRDVDDATSKLKNARYSIVDGANHAAFGDYGRQPGDGEMKTSDQAVQDAITTGIVNLNR